MELFVLSMISRFLSVRSCWICFGAAIMQYSDDFWEVKDITGISCDHRGNPVLLFFPAPQKASNHSGWMFESACKTFGLQMVQ